MSEQVIFFLFITDGVQ